MAQDLLDTLDAHQIERATFIGHSMGGKAVMALIADHDIVQVDMRNHGLSPRSPEMTYPAMAQDLLDTLDAHQIERATFIGHSMGGKAVMAL
ncbi:alpha/beta fold hydrolase, partial [Escherichia coli]|uniref:alpha/beta fold hydrolase n=1 Tax=Escherichia coli TaxID=562 RepID=UPI00201A9FC6